MKVWDQLFNLEGETVYLRAMEIGHLDGLWQAAEPEAIWSYMASKIRSKAEMEKAIIMAVEERKKGNQYPFVVFDKKNHRILGSTRYLDISQANKNLEIGWTWYHPDVWRTRVNTECKFLMLKHAFEKFQFNRVHLKTDSRNIRSQQAISRLGAIKEGILRQDRVLADGYIRNTVVYSIIKEEWPEVKKALIEKLK